MPNDIPPIVFDLLSFLEKAPETDRAFESVDADWHDALVIARHRGFVSPPIGKSWNELTRIQQAAVIVSKGAMTPYPDPRWCTLTSTGLERLARHRIYGVSEQLTPAPAPDAEPTPAGTTEATEDARLDRLRAAMATLGRDAKPEAILREAKVGDASGRRLLRDLEGQGDYIGFARDAPSRYTS